MFSVPLPSSGLDLVAGWDEPPEGNPPPEHSSQHRSQPWPLRQSLQLGTNPFHPTFICWIQRLGQESCRQVRVRGASATASRVALPFQVKRKQEAKELSYAASSFARCQIIIVILY